MLCVSGKKTWGETTTQVVLFCDQPWVNNGRIPPMGTNDNGSKNCQLIIIPVKVKRKQVRPTKQQTRFVEEEKRIGILMPSTLNWTGLNGWVATRRYTNRICEKTKKVDRQTEVNRPVDSESLKHLVRPFFFFAFIRRQPKEKTIIPPWKKKKVDMK